MNIRQRLYVVILLIFIIVMLGSTGYYLLYGGKPGFMDCIFMTVISLTSVGYGEILPVTGNVAAQIYTMILITFGMGILMYCISTLTALLVEGELSGILKKKRMQKRINELNNHIIVCGGGETGRPLIDELIKNKETILLLEQSIDVIQHCLSDHDIPYIQGDASDDQNLIKSGIDRAFGIIICLPSDKDNLYVTMTARMLNRSLRIITRMTNPIIEPKLRKAGADQVVSPNTIGALRMASVMIRPTVVDFLDRMLRSTQGTLRIHEIPVSRQTELIGKSIIQSELKQKHNLLILGYKDKNDEMKFNPEPSLILEDGMQLIVMGEIDNIEKARHIR